jgi:hypothetical protein
MPDTIETLHAKMEAAARALDFEEARRLRDMIGMIRGGATPDEADHAEFAGLTRQQPGAMGLGTSQQRVTPPAGWTPPPKPDPMTAGRSTRGRRTRP